MKKRVVIKEETKEEREEKEGRKKMLDLSKLLKRVFKILKQKVEVKLEETEKAITVDGWIEIGLCWINEPHTNWRGEVPYEEPIEVVGYSINTAHYSHGTYWEPPDVDVIEVGQTSRTSEAVDKITEIYFRNLVDNALTGIAEEEQAREYLKYKKAKKAGKLIADLL